MLEVNAFDGQQILPRPLEMDKKIIFKNSSLTLRQYPISQFKTEQISNHIL